MRVVILEFIWKHIRKLISAAFMAICYGLWSFIQMPYQAAADILSLKDSTDQIHKELRTLQIGNGVNNNLLIRVDGKLDKLQESVIRMSVQRRTE